MFSLVLLVTCDSNVCWFCDRPVATRSLVQALTVEVTIFQSFLPHPHVDLDVNQCVGVWSVKDRRRGKVLLQLMCLKIRLISLTDLGPIGLTFTCRP